MAVGAESYAFELEHGRVSRTGASLFSGLHALALRAYATGRAVTVGRSGGGPGESARSASMSPWTDGCSTVVDPVMRRITVLQLTFAQLHGGHTAFAEVANDAVAAVERGVQTVGL